MDDILDDVKKYYERYRSFSLKNVRSDTDSLDVEILFNDKTVSSLERLLHRLLPKSVLFLLGNGGSGKTYAFLKCWTNLIKNRCAIYIQLHQLDTSQPSVKIQIDKSIFSNINEKTEMFYDFWSNNHGSLPLILFLDGFNEIPNKIQKKVWREVQELADELNIVIVISSRYADNLKNKVRDVFCAEMRTLSTYKIRTYLKKHKADTSAINNEELLGLLSNPLMLSLYAQTSMYYDAVAVNKTKTECGGSIKFYGPIYSSSTIIWNYFQYELMKEIEEFDSSEIEKMFSFLTVNYILPSICYVMQKRQKITITKKQLRKEINLALQTYSKINDESEKFRALTGYLEHYEPVIFNHETDTERIFSLSTKKLQLFKPINITINESEDEDDEAQYELFHQQLRDCLAAMHLINGMEICKEDAILPYLAIDDIRFNQPMVQHIAFLEERNGCESINEQWKLLKSLSSVKLQLIGSEVKIDILINNLVNIYKFVYGGNFSELNFEGVDLRNVALSGFKFQPVVNPNSFKDAIFGTKTFTLGGHSGVIANLSACGNRMVSRDPDSIRVWNIDTGECIDIPFIEDEYNDEATGLCVDLLPINENVIIYSQGSNIIEKNLELSEEKNFIGANCNISHLIYSPNGQYIMSCGENGEVNVWNRADNKNPVYSDSNTVCCQTDIFGSNVITFKYFNTLSNGKLIKIQIVDFITQNEVLIPYTFEEGERLTAACFSQDGNSILFATTRKVANNNHIVDFCLLHVWKIGGILPVATIENSLKADVATIKVHKNGLLVATISNNGTASLWNIDNATPKEIASFSGVSSVAFFNSTYLPINDAHKIREDRVFFVGLFSGDIFSYEYHNELTYIYTKYDGHRPYVYDIALNPMKPHCVGAYSDGVLRQWDYKTGAPIHNYIENRSFVYCVEYDMSGEYFVSGHTNGSIWLWDAVNMLPIDSFCDENGTAHTETVRDIKFTNDGKMISCANDNTIKIWDVEARDVVNVLKEHDDFVKCLLYYEEGIEKRLVSGSTDCSIIVWDISDCKKCKVIKKHIIHKNRVRSLSLYKEQRVFVSNSEDGYVYEWDIITGEKTERYLYIENDYNRHHTAKRSAEAIAYSADGEKVIVSSERNGFNDGGIVSSLELIDFSNPQKKLTYPVHTGGITSAEFIDEKTIISSSMDGAICVTDLISNNTKKLTPATSFTDELDGYNHDTIRFVPNWIRSYYYGSSMNTQNIKIPQTLDSLLDAYQKNVGLNIFDYIMKEDDVSIVIDLFLACTKGVASNNDRAMLAKEKQFLLANAYYLWYEAPPDEQNMYMLAELFRAYEVRDGQEEFKSDLDRLFDMLEEKNTEHIALLHHRKFKRYFGSDKVVKSCLSRLESVCCDFNPSKNINNGVKSVDDYRRFIETFHSNTKNQKGAGEICTDAERLLVVALLDFMRENSFPEEEMMNEFSKVLQHTLRYKPSEAHEEVWMTDDLKIFSRLSDSEKKSALSSFVSRFAFWREFLNADKAFKNFDTDKINESRIYDTTSDKKRVPSDEDKKSPKDLEQIEVVELFDDEGQSMLFELLETIEHNDNRYFLLTAYAEEAPADDVPADVFIMCEVEKNGDKMLEPLDDRSVMEEIFEMFKNRNFGNFDFV